MDSFSKSKNILSSPMSGDKKQSKSPPEVGKGQSTFMVDIHYFLPSLKQEHRKNDGIIISEQVPPRKVNVDIIDPVILKTLQWPFDIIDPVILKTLQWPFDILSQEDLVKVDI